MTLKTSLFNKGIFKNNIKRFKWGSFLYFIMLFFAVPFPLLVQEPANLWNRYHTTRYLGSVLFANDYLVFALLFTLVVPTVVAALVFHNVHSSKQGIFVHGLPVSRKANYISSLLSSFTLMALPVILNGIILLIMSFNSYSKLIYPVSVLYWVLGFLAILFIMFSVSTFTAYLTGNAAAGIVVNVFVHVFPFVVALATYGVGEEFLYGFTAGDSFVGNLIVENTPIYYFMTLVSKGLKDFFANGITWIYLVISLILYVAAYFVYKFRKIEACGDVAAFKSFRAVIKYAVVSSVAIAGLCLLIAIGLEWTVASLVVFIVCAIVYFACEMVLSKSFKVFSTYKGYLVFTAAVAALISFFAFTSVFGYETRIPEIDKIESASLGRGYGIETYYLENEEDIALVMGMHKDFVTDISAREKHIENEEYAYAFVSYKLKNEKEMLRRYVVPRKEFEKCMNRMYEIKEYKLGVTGIDRINVENVSYFNLNCSNSYFSYGTGVTDGAAEIFSAIKKDIEELSFTEIENATSMNFDVSLSETYKNNKISRVFKEIKVYEFEDEEYATEYFHFSVNGNFKNTINALKKYGYYDEMMSRASKNFYICRVPAHKEKDTILVKYKEDEGSIHNFYVSTEDCIAISEQDGISIVEDMFVNYRDIYMQHGEMYMIFYIEKMDEIDKMQLSTASAAYEKDELPEFLKKYLQ